MRTKLKDYIEMYLMQNVSSPNAPIRDPPYLFSTGKGQMIRDIEVPKYFHGTDRYELNSRARDQKALFYIGTAGTNTYFHQHATAYNFLTAGRKKWYLLPPSANIGPTITTLPWWIENVMPRLKIKPIECIQHPGEILFIPNGWFHVSSTRHQNSNKKIIKTNSVHFLRNRQFIILTKLLALRSRLVTTSSYLMSLAAS